MNDYIYHNMRDETDYQFPNFNGAAVEVWEWINNFIHILQGMWLLIHAGIYLLQFIYLVSVFLKKKEWYMRSVVSEAQVSKAGTSNYIPQYLRDVITCAWPCYLRFWHNTPDIEEP